MKIIKEIKNDQGIVIRRKVSHDYSKGKSMTDQSAKKSSDINNIMKQYLKTKVLPSTKEHLARYVDNTEIPSLEESYEKIQTAKQLFMELPSNIRRLMDHDPKKLPEFLMDKKNYDILVKEGVISAKQNQEDKSSLKPKTDVVGKESGASVKTKETGDKVE